MKHLQQFAVSQMRQSVTDSQRGSLALEQVLFIGAIVTMSLGLFAFYDNLAAYFRNFNITSLPTAPSVPGGTNTGTNTN